MQIDRKSFVPTPAHNNRLQLRLRLQQNLTDSTDSGVDSDSTTLVWAQTAISKNTDAIQIKMGAQVNRVVARNFDLGPFLFLWKNLGRSVFW